MQRDCGGHSKWLASSLNHGGYIMYRKQLPAEIKGWAVLSRSKNEAMEIKSVWLLKSQTIFVSTGTMLGV